MIVSGVVDPVDGVEAAAIGGGSVVACRLHAERRVLADRLRRRGAFTDALVAERMADVAFGGWSVDTTHRTVGDVASAVLEHLDGWPPDTSFAPSSEPAPLPAPDPADVLWVCGPAGVGKSVVAFRAYLDAVAAGVAVAFVDVDQIAMFDSKSRVGLRARNLGAVWSTYASAGAAALVAVGPVSSARDARAYEAALPNATFRWCRLHAATPELARRIHTRRDGGAWAQPGDPLRGASAQLIERAIARSIADAARLERATFGLRVDVTELTVEQAAAAVVARSGWPAGRRQWPARPSRNDRR